MFDSTLSADAAATATALVVAALIAAWAAIRTRAGIRSIHAEIKTNDGTRAGDYIEATARRVVALEAGQQELVFQLAKMKLRQQFSDALAKACHEKVEERFGSAARLLVEHDGRQSEGFERLRGWTK